MQCWEPIPGERKSKPVPLSGPHEERDCFHFLKIFCDWGSLQTFFCECHRHIRNLQINDIHGNHIYRSFPCSHQHQVQGRAWWSWKSNLVRITLYLFLICSSSLLLQILNLKMIYALLFCVPACMMCIYRCLVEYIQEYKLQEWNSLLPTLYMGSWDWPQVARFACVFTYWAVLLAQLQQFPLYLFPLVLYSGGRTPHNLLPSRRLDLSLMIYGSLNF